MGDLASRFQPVFRFGIFEVDLRAGELRRGGLKVRLQEKPLQILALLLESPGEVVSREELQRKLWPADVFVGFDHSLNNAVNRLREALNDSSSHPRYIETLPRHGYRFIAPVEPVVSAPNPQVAESTPSAHGSNGPVSAGTVLAPPSRALPRWTLSLALTVVLLAVAYYGWQRFRPRPVPNNGKVMLAVLPFQNLSGDPEQEYFSDGLTEEMITQLGGLIPDQLGVIARTSAMTYKGSNKPVDQIGRELKVDFVLEGSVRRVDERVRISAQLIRVDDQTHLWARSYDKDLRDLLEVQGEVAQAIAREIRLSLSPETQTRLARVGPVNPDAYHSYLRGRYSLNKRTGEGLSQAVKYFQQAIDQESDYVLAYAGLAEASVLLGDYRYLPVGETLPRAKTAALKAVELDENLAEAHASLAYVYLANDWDWPAAEREYKRALELNPNCAIAHHWYALYLSWSGRFDEALEEIQLAKELDPLSVIINANVGWIYYFARRNDRAIEELRKVLQLEPDSPTAHWKLAYAYQQDGLYEEAIEELRKSGDISGVELTPYLAHAYALAGDTAKAHRLLTDLKMQPKRRYVTSFEMALVYTGLEETDQAFAWLEKAFEERDTWLLWLKVEPWFDPLRSDPRFESLVRRMNFPE